MTADIPLDKAYLIAVWLETILYGMNFVLFFSYLYIIRYKRKSRLNRFTHIAAIIMFCFSTSHVSMEFQRLIEGFIYLRNRPGGPAAFFSDVSIPANVAKFCIHTINSVLGDSVVVWRCYHVWGQNWRVCAFPVFLVLASAICGFAQSVYFAMAKGGDGIFRTELQSWNGALFTLSFFTNVLVTVLITLRIWYISRFVSIQSDGSFDRNRYSKVLAVVIESGAIYSTAILFEIIFYLMKSNVFYIVYDPFCQLTGMVPTMIIVMSSLGLTANDSHTAELEMKSPLRFATMESHHEPMRNGSSGSYLGVEELHRS